MGYKNDPRTEVIIEMLKLADVMIDHPTKSVMIDDYIIPFSKLTGRIWGFIYEKYVGQILEKANYKVKYQGLKLGPADGGIDLIADKGNNKYYIQCKLKKSSFSKSHIENILYQASQTLLTASEESPGNVNFILVVNDISANFSKRMPKGLNFPVDIDLKKIKYPLLEYFLSHNQTQDKVKLKVKEVKMKDYEEISN